MFRVKIISRVIFLCLFIFSIQALAEIYYIPHIHTGSDAWETYLIINNSDGVDITLHGYYYDSNGNEVANATYTLAGFETKKIPLRNLGAVAGKIVSSYNWVRVRLGYIAKDSLGGGTAEFSPTTKLATRMIMNLSNYYDELTWSGFALWNATASDVEVTLRAYSSTGSVKQKTITMNPYEKIVDYFDTYFETDSFTDIDSVTIMADKPSLCGVVISGKENDKLLFSSPNQFQNYVSHTELLDGNYTETNIVYVNGKYHYFVENKDNGKLYFVSCDIFGPGDTILSRPFNENITINRIVPSSSDNSIFILGRTGTNAKVIKVDTDGTKLWEKTVGTMPSSSFDPYDYKMIGGEIDNTLLVIFRDSSLTKTKKVFLNSGTGDQIYTTSSTETAKLGDMISYYDDTGNPRFAYSFSYYSDWLQLLIIDPSNNLIKQIYGSSPLTDNNDDIDHQILGMTKYSDKFYFVVGKEVPIVTGWRQYQLFMLTISINDSNFNNATITDLTHFLPYGSEAFVFPSVNFNDESTVEIVTKPILNDYTSTIFLINKDNNNIPQNFPYFRRNLPYIVNGIGFHIFGIAINTYEPYYVSFDNKYSKLSFKFLSVEDDQMLNE